MQCLTGTLYPTLVADMPKEDILHHLDTCADFISMAMAQKGRVLVHWWVRLAVYPINLVIKVFIIYLEISSFISSPSFAVISVILALVAVLPSSSLSLWNSTIWSIRRRLSWCVPSVALCNPIRALCRNWSFIDAWAAKSIHSISGTNSIGCVWRANKCAKVNSLTCITTKYI